MTHERPLVKGLLDDAAVRKRSNSPFDGDVMHAEFLTKVERLKIGLVALDMVEALEEIEGFRALFVRGSAPGGEGAARRALECLDLVREVALTARSIRSDALQ